MSSLRWLAAGVLVLSTALSFLDRQVLAALAPVLMQQFQLSNEGYGYIVAAFSIAYAVCAPASGLLVDRIGLSAGLLITISVWSSAGIATGFAAGFGTLLACRAALGAAESGGIPATIKGFALYLAPREWALGTALNQVGITLGMVGAPLLVGCFAPVYGWRGVFIATGIVGFAWIPLWLATSRFLPAPAQAKASGPTTNPVRDWRLWALAAANFLMMTVYSLWMNWTTVFLVSVHGLSPADANRHFAWIPPVFASLGGIFGGWMTMQWTTTGRALYRARLRTCIISATVLTSTALVPFAPGLAASTALICLSFFMAVAMSVNIYAMPIDIFGANRTAFAVSILTASYGLMQTVMSPLFGRLIDNYGFGPVCVSAGALPLASLLLLLLVGKYMDAATVDGRQ
jgi:MFS transporter, ACS family, hexuronate transporter